MLKISVLTRRSVSPTFTFRHSVHFKHKSKFLFLLSIQQLLRTQNQKHHEEQQTSIKIPSPGDPSAYFAPISPAAKTETPPMPPSQPEIAINPIMEMLRAGNAKSKKSKITNTVEKSP